MTQCLLYCLVGLPGSGKSYFIKNEMDESFYVHSTDAVIEEYAKTVGKTYSEVFNTYIKEASKISTQQLKEAIDQWRSIIWDQTNMSQKKRGKILKQFPDEYIKICICFLPPINEDQEAELARRLLNRPGKFIPDNVMENFRNAFLPPSHNEGWNRIIYKNLYGVNCDVLGNPLTF